MTTATTVPKGFGTGGKGLTPNKSAGKPDLETILRDHETQINNGTFAPLSNTAPADVGVADNAGVATEASRRDHVHADPMRTAKGADLGDTSPAITVAQGHWRVLPTAVLTADRTVTLSAAGAVAGDQIDITRLDVTAHQLIIVNGGVGAGTLFTMANSKVGCAKFQFDGTNWALRSFGVQ